MAASKSNSTNRNNTTKKKTTSRSTSNSRGTSNSGKGRTSSGSGPRKNTKAYERQRELERQEAMTPPETKREIYALICFAINLVLVLGTYGICGKAGTVVSGFFFGIFGALFYVLPFAFVIAYCFLMANGPKPKLIKKFIWCFMLAMSIGFICQLVVGTSSVGIKELYLDGYSDHRGGGILFGGIIVLVAKLISRVGALIFTLLLLIIAVIMITGIKLTDMFKSMFAYGFDREVKTYDDEDDDYDDDGYYYGDEDLLVSKLQKKGMLKDIRVLDENGKTSASTKKSREKKEKKNKIVPDEEMTEIVPNVDLSGTQTATPKKYLPEAQGTIALPGQMPRDIRRPVTSNEMLEEFNSTNAFYNQGSNPRPSETIAPEYKPKDIFELEVDARTYADPLGSDIDYNENSGRVSTNYAGPSRRNKSTSNPVEPAAPAAPSTPAFTGAGPAFASSGPAFAAPPSDSVDGGVMPEEDTPAPDEEKVTHEDKLKATQEIGTAIDQAAENRKKYVFPPKKLLKSGGRYAFDRTGDASVRETAITLKNALESFGVNVTITNYSIGPAITRYELQPEMGVRVNKILQLENDIKMALAATDIRIEAPIPGKAAVGIEIPNKNNQTVYFRDLIENDTFDKFKSNVAFAVGKGISGQIIIADIAKMPHLLIAGATGSGKSVCINTLIMSILYKSAPEDVRMIMIDPKQVELTAYNGIPHLLIPVVTDPKKAAGALNWAVDEMTKRYQLFANYNVRNLEGFNRKVEEIGVNEDPQFKHMPQLIVIVDELADLMMVAHKEVEDSIVRLSQLARAAGIHLVIATQRPSVDVITGLIKANVPSRIAFAVSSGVDSRTIIDMVGAEKLLGKGDMLFYPTGYTKPVRVQGAFIDDDEVVKVVEFIKNNYGETSYDSQISQSIDTQSVGSAASAGGGDEDDSRYDELFEDAARSVIDKDKASIGYIQRVHRIGFNRAARIMDQLEEFGVVGPEEGTKPRKVLMTMTEFDEKMGSI